jgi:DNA-binding XRE family transcriptional regulator
MLQITNDNIREILKGMMAEAEYTAEEMHNDAGVSRRTAEIQNDNPTLKTLNKMFDVLGYEVVIRRKDERNTDINCLTGLADVRPDRGNGYT